MACFYDHTRECLFRPRHEDTSDHGLDPENGRVGASGDADTPIFRGFEFLEIVTMLRELVEQCFAEAPEPFGMPLMLSRCILAGMLHNCAEMVSLGVAGERGVRELQNTPIADVEVQLPRLRHRLTQRTGRRTSPTGGTSRAFR